MTSRATAPPLGTVLKGQYDALRRAAVLRHALRASAAIAILITLAVALGLAWRMGPSGAWTRLGLLALAALALLALACARVRAAVPTFASFLDGIESRFPDLRSLIRNAFDLERAESPHTSGELAAALRDQAARRLPVTLVVEPGSVKLSPGATLSIRAHVTGTQSAPRLERGGGHAPAAVDEGGTAANHAWRFDLPPITREEDYRVRVAAVASPGYHITLSGEAQPVSFEVEYRAPSYARLPIQHGSATRGDLTALYGTRAAVEVTFDRDLTALDARAPGGGAVRFTARSPRRWSGTLAIEREGEWELAATTPAAAAHFRYAIHPIADQPPVIAVRIPTGDLDLPDGQAIPLEVLGQDDLGLSALELEVQRSGDAAWQRVPIARFEGEPREAHVASHWDAAPLGLLPGQSATFRFALYDNNVFGRGVARSGTYTLRFPSLNELYKAVSDRQETAQGSLEKVADQARELQKKRVSTRRPSGARSATICRRSCASCSSW